MSATGPVFVIEDDAAVRDSLVLVLRGEGLQARGFASGADFFGQLPDEPSACVVPDVRMPGMDGTEVARRIAELPDRAWPVIVVTGHADVPLAVRMMKSGIVDFLEKPVDPPRLIGTVRGALASLKDLSRRQAARLAAETRAASLTPRERQVFDALVEGRANKEIAQQLSISPRTVEIFRARVMAKMEADSLSALVRMGVMLESG